MSGTPTALDEEGRRAAFSAAIALPRPKPKWWLVVAIRQEFRQSLCSFVNASRSLVLVISNAATIFCWRFVAASNFSSCSNGWLNCFAILFALPVVVLEVGFAFFESLFEAAECVLY